VNFDKYQAMNMLANTQVRYQELTTRLRFVALAEQMKRWSSGLAL